VKENRINARVNAQIVDEAAAWFVEFSEGDVDARGRSEFNRWLRTSPEHVRAYLQISALWENSSLIRGSSHDAGALIARALAEENVVSFGSASPPIPAAPALLPQNPLPKLRLHAIGFLLILVCAIAGAGLWFEYYRVPFYATELGEQRTITLSDGSTVQLNSHSRIRIRFTPQSRALDLIEGQALFRVVKDHARPFLVRSNGVGVRAVGTQFDVYRKENGTVVTVLEGRVAVLAKAGEGAGLDANPSAQAGNPAPVLVSAGEQITATPRAVGTPRRADTAAAVAWTQQRLVFDFAPLSEVVDEFNRYNVRKLVIKDEKLRGFHISGDFPSGDPGLFVQFVRERFGVSVSQTDAEILISRDSAR
jgi:transmembrane sensor